MNVYIVKYYRLKLEKAFVSKEIDAHQHVKCHRGQSILTQLAVLNTAHSVRPSL